MAGAARFASNPLADKSRAMIAGSATKEHVENDYCAMPNDQLQAE